MNAKKTYNIPPTAEVEIFNKNFLIKPSIFSNLVQQYISSTDFVLDIKLINDNITNTASILTAGFESQSSWPNKSQEIVFQDDVFQPLACVNDDVFYLSQNNSVNKHVYPTIPTTEEIKQISEIRHLMKYNTLENKDRTNIAKIIVSHILRENPNRRIYKEEFEKLSQSIIDVFPSEVIETYYVPYTKGHLAKGKLFDAYNNKRTKLSSQGLINRRTNLKKNLNQDPLPPIQDTGVTPEELELLQTVGLDLDKTKDLWIKSHSCRQAELQNNNLSTLDYIKKYNINLNENFYELLHIDFKLLYPSSKEFYEWKIYYEKLIQKAEQLKESTVLNILANINRAEDEDSKLVLSLMLIPYVLPHYRKKTKLESLESFIYYCKNIYVADDETRNRIKRIKTETQPKIYLVGDTVKPLSVAYVDICGTRMKFENPLKAIDACFYSYMAMNVKYPIACVHVWTFIQKIIYDINTPYDTIIPAVSTLINELRKNVE
ncbi:uncharacterized protein isoform X2 [Musca autumnalis]|uniref:uncharacterized protein isoform X2 n=1 Tax=Musca autumnalis TaxID=221902 RepID=UPI003CECBDF1